MNNILLLTVTILAHLLSFSYIVSCKKSDTSYGGHTTVWFDGHPVLLTLAFITWIGTAFPLFYFAQTIPAIFQ